MAQLKNLLVLGAARFVNVIKGTSTKAQNGCYYGTCTTAAGTAAKEITIDDPQFALQKGTMIAVKFTNSNTASSVTFNVNGTGAKSIVFQGSVYTANGVTICGFNNYVHYYVYDGTYWVFLNHSGNNNTSDQSVKQQGISDNGNYPVLLSPSTGTDTITDIARKNTAFTYNPSTGNLRTTQINGAAVGDSPKFTDTVFMHDAQAKQTKTYSSVICSGTATDAGDTNLFCIKIIPTNYNNTWSLLYRVTGTVAGVTEANGSGYQESYVYIQGMRDTYATYYTWNNVRNTSYRPFYYHVIYRAKAAGITGNYGHVMGLGLRSSYNCTTAANAREITFEILDYTDCTVSFFDSMTKYASIPGTGTTNYSGQTEFNGSQQGFTRTGSDANNYDRLLMPSVRFTAGTSGVFPYTLCMEDSTGKWQAIVTSSGSGTGKARNTTGFKLGDIFYQAYNETITNGNLIRAGYLYRSMSFDFRYSSNCAKTLTQYAPIYLVGTVNSSDGLFYLDSTWWTQTLPTTDDGKVYIHIGYTYSNYQVWMDAVNKMYVYKNGKVREYIQGLDEIFNDIETLLAAI